MNVLGGNIYDGIDPSGITHVQGWNSTMPTFERLIRHKKPQTIIEVGTWLGASAIHMGKICKAIGIETKIYCIDTWLGAQEFWTRDSAKPDWDLRQRNGYPQVYFDFLANVVQAGLQETIIPIPNTSLIGARILQSMGIFADLIYIDASHDYEDVVADIAAYSPLAKNGAIMFGDDINWQSVKDAVDQELPGYSVEFPFWIKEL
jgi:predicted O-methyltransferase YrrM